jgi:glutamate 5-kinase
MASLRAAKRLVVKIGSALLVDRVSGDLRADWLHALALDVAEIKGRGTDVILVSSGSIALGRGVLGLPAGTLALEQSQAAATMEQLLRLGTVPIVNENDTVATDEIRFGDNDRLAAQIAVTVGADVLVLLSDVDGFYSGDPRQDPSARRYDVVDHITPQIEAMAGDVGSGLSKGGMKTKIMAAKTATGAGCALAITEGSVMRPLSALEQGAAVTWFTAQGDPQAARKRWIAAMKPKGDIVVDAGAARALSKGNSLLPAGVTQVTGKFGRGDLVTISGPEGALGMGLVRYTRAEADAIKGRQSSEIEALLGYPGRAALVHRDDMVT